MTDLLALIAWPTTMNEAGRRVNVPGRGHHLAGGSDMAQRRSLEDRFWSKVDVRGPDDCWLWTGGRAGKGYGHIKSDGRGRNAHAVGWELATGRAVPTGLVVRHSCDNPPCCNPAHLLIGTVADNHADMIERGRKARNQFAQRTECSAGHAYTPENTRYFVRDGMARRQCRICQRGHVQANRRKNR